LYTQLQLSTARIRREGDLKVCTIPKASSFEVGQDILILSVEELFQKGLRGNLNLKDVENHELNSKEKPANDQ